MWPRLVPLAAMAMVIATQPSFSAVTAYARDEAPACVMELEVSTQASAFDDYRPWRTSDLEACLFDWISIRSNCYSSVKEFAKLGAEIYQVFRAESLFSIGDPRHFPADGLTINMSWIDYDREFFRRGFLGSLRGMKNSASIQIKCYPSGMPYWVQITQAVK